MYKLLIGFYLIYSARNNLSHLIENGIDLSQYSRVDWVLLILSILMIPLAFLMFYFGYKDLKQKQKEQEEEKRIELEKNNARKEELFSDFNANENECDSSRKDDEGHRNQSRFDT